MRSAQPKVTGELRKWRRNGMTICGKMYNDAKGIWFDGEDAVVVFQRWEESPTYFLAVTAQSAIKCSKDEMVENNGSVDP